MNREETSRTLHERVRSFIETSVTGSPAETFDSLACAIARLGVSPHGTAML